MRVPEVIPDVDVLTALAPEELAGVLLKLAAEPEHRGQVMMSSVASPESLFGPIYAQGDARGYYPKSREHWVNQAIAEAWRWLELNLLILPAAGTNGQNGWRVLSRRAQAILTDNGFDQYRSAAEFPKALLHPRIGDQVWHHLARRDPSLAVFIAFRTVEEAVRQAGGYPPELIGVDLMRTAFAPNKGNLAKKGDPKAEQGKRGFSHTFPTAD